MAQKQQKKKNLKNQMQKKKHNQETNEQLGSDTSDISASRHVIARQSHSELCEAW